MLVSRLRKIPQLCRIRRYEKYTLAHIVYGMVLSVTTEPLRVTL